MSGLLVGMRMLRVEDGMQGVVEVTTPPGIERYQEPRIVYFDRGERRIASKLEKWVPDDPPSSKMRSEERLLVAYAADRQLESLEKNQPDRRWEPLDGKRPIHDLGLVQAIDEYLGKR